MYQTYFVEGIKGCMPIIEPMLTTHTQGYKVVTIALKLEEFLT